MQTREQIYADSVFKLVSHLKASEQERNEYGSMAHKLPVLIRTAGLAQALAFVDTRKKPQQQLLDDLALVVLKAQEREVLLARSRNAPLDEYMRLTQETLHALLWFKRYAQSVLGVEDASQEEQGDVKPS